MTNVPKSGSPPAFTAPIDTAINAPEVPMNKEKPAPKRPMGRACRMVTKPEIKRAANTTQETSRMSSAAFNTIIGVMAMPLTIRATLCKPSSADVMWDGCSSTA
jgi:hypothetical protein